MGNLVFQATLGGQVNLVGPNTASTYNINVPTVNGNMVTTGDTGTVTNTMCATSVYTAPGTIGSGTPNTGAFTTLSASGVATISAGSASAPALTTSGDTNTGMLFPAADTIAWTTGGTERLRLDSSGNLGLGVTPSAWATYKALQVDNGAIANYSPTQDASYLSNAYYNAGWKYIASAYALRYAQDGSGGSHKWYTAASGTAGNAISFTQAMTLDASGNLGVGTTSPYSFGSGHVIVDISAPSTKSANLYLHGNGSSGNTGGLQLQSSTGDCGIYQQSNLPMVFATNNLERMRIDSSGNLLVNVSNPANIDGVITSSAPTATRNCLGLRDSGTSYGTGNWYISFVNSAGASAGAIQHTAATTVAYATSSDKRLKENIVDAPSALDKVLSTKVRSFDWKEDKLHVDYGFIAQELYEVASEAVGKGDDLEVLENPKGTWQVEYGRLTPMLVKAIQELKAINDQQAETLTQKTEAINALTARVVALEAK